LSDADLKTLGLPMGPRKLVLAAIAELGKRDPATTAGIEPIPGSGPSPRPEAERRQLTVMFVDLAGSTALSGQLDPEEMGEVIRTYQTAVAEEIRRVDGHVAKFMGDGVLAYFGWPRAHEDEAERAVRAGLAIAVAVAKLATPAKAPLRVRVGIATGLVVVGDLIGDLGQFHSGVSQKPSWGKHRLLLGAHATFCGSPGTAPFPGSHRRISPTSNGQSCLLKDQGHSPV
jgi:hypothetical protein